MGPACMRQALLLGMIRCSMITDHQKRSQHTSGWHLSGSGAGHSMAMSGKPMTMTMTNQD